MDIWSMEMKELFLWSMLPMELSENTWIVSIHGNFIDLAVRLDVAIDVAHAITYLHMYTVTGRRPIEAKRDIKERITARWVQYSSPSVCSLNTSLAK
ncbi:hypothetical protein OIU79_019446 [Salix purpurea]|uniref:Uncharacterized protein n=1 Tax=Salix purpurea TaxID=77065 RepID=A0A9Q0SJ55_SALPP|nr:hypothetical protein OIU79_019446 [Salix purpurea]